MAGIVFDLSPREGLQKFLELAEMILDVNNTLTEHLLIKLEEKARILNVHKFDFNAVILNSLSRSGGKGFTLAYLGNDRHEIICASCGATTSDVLWHCPACRKPFVGSQSNFICNITGIEFVYVNGGMFQMGDLYADEENYTGEELPVHSVRLDGFYISKTPVTRRQYEMFAKETNRFHPQVCNNEIAANVDIYEEEQTENKVAIANKRYEDIIATRSLLPITHVFWHDATAFTSWLSTKCGKSARLPTEAEWEYASRSRGNADRWSGTSETDKFDEYAWYSGNTEPINCTNSVGKKKPNSLDLYDMSGNVWEWCQDWYERYYYESSPKDNPRGPNQGLFRVLRGGSWMECGKRTRVCARDSAQPDICTESIGFRVVCI